MKTPKGLFILLVCIGMLLGYSAHAQEEAADSQETELESSQEVEFEQEQPEQQEEPTPVYEEQLPEQPQEAAVPDGLVGVEDSGQQPEPESVSNQEAQPQQEEPQPQESSEQDPSAEGEQSESAQPAQEQEGDGSASQDGQVESEESAPQEEQPAQEAEVSMPPDEVMGLDTVDLEDPQGNWLFKRVWWERSEQKIEKIRALVTQIMEKRSGFFAKQAELDKDVLDPFYIDIGIKRGALTQKIADMLSDIKKQEQMHRPDTVAFEKLQKDKKELDELSKEVEKVTKQDEAVGKALLQLVDQINKLRSYEQQAWQDFKDIARVLDDKKARELFYKIDNAWQNVQKVQEYVEQSFTGSFDKLVEDVKKQINRIKNDVDALKERGVILSKQLGIHDEDSDEDEQEEQPKQERLSSFFNSIIDMFRYTFNTFAAIVRWPYDKLIGTGKAAQQAMQEREEMDAEIDFDEEPEYVSEPETQSETIIETEVVEPPAEPQEPMETQDMSEQPEAVVDEPILEELSVEEKMQDVSEQPEIEQEESPAQPEPDTADFSQDEPVDFSDELDSSSQDSDESSYEEEEESPLE